MEIQPHVQFPRPKKERTAEQFRHLPTEPVEVVLLMKQLEQAAFTAAAANRSMLTAIERSASSNENTVEDLVNTLKDIDVDARERIQTILAEIPQAEESDLATAEEDLLYNKKMLNEYKKMYRNTDRCNREMVRNAQRALYNHTSLSKLIARLKVLDEVKLHGTPSEMHH